MQSTYPITDTLGFAFLLGGGICAFIIRTMTAGPARGWTKLASFLLIAVSFFFWGMGTLHEQQRRTITPVTTLGTLTNLHEESGGPKQSNVQHYMIDDGTGSPPLDLHDQDPVFFMKAQNGEKVEATYTRETGYVSHLRIIDGPHKGYEFNEPDTRNLMPSLFAFFMALIVAIVGLFKWIVDHDADPALDS